MEIEKYSNDESRYSIELYVYLSHEIKNYSVVFIVNYAML